MTVPVLWLKFPDEAIFAARFDAEGRAALEKVFSVANRNSPWREALSLLGMQTPANTANLLRWHEGAPYFNASAMVQTVSGGIAMPVKTEEGGYAYDSCTSVPRLWRLVVIQWKVARFLRDMEAVPDSVTASVALGLALQALLIRLGTHADQLDEWLAKPEAAPASYRSVVTQIQAIQVRRTAMSYVWRPVFGTTARDIGENELPEFFWDDALPLPAQDTQKTVSVLQKEGQIKGRPVCAGVLTGTAVAMPIEAEALAALKEAGKVPLILVFRYARPEAVEFFPYADALVFCTGGALSHACTVARESGIPCVTAAGNGFWEFAKDKEPFALMLDGAAGTLQIIADAEDPS